MLKFGRTVISLILLFLGIAIIFVCGKLFQFTILDSVYLTLFIVCIETCLQVVLVSSIEDVTTKNLEGIYKTAYIRKSIWIKSSVIWMVLHYWLISASFLSTLIIVYITSAGGDERDDKRIIFYSVMSLFTSIMSYVLNPLAISKGYKRAYQEIDKAIFKYQKSNNKKEKILYDALIKAEKQINKYSFR